MSKKKNILLQMFDVKPTDVFGNVDVLRLMRLERVIRLEQKRTSLERERVARAIQKSTEAPYQMEGGAITKFRGHVRVPFAHPVDPPLPKKTSGDSFRGPEFLPANIYPEVYRHTAGLEGHNLLPSRTELERHLSEIEKRDERLRLLGYLAKELKEDMGERGDTSGRKITRDNPASPRVLPKERGGRRRAVQWSALAIVPLLALLIFTVTPYVSKKIALQKEAAIRESAGAVEKLLEGVSALRGKNFADAGTRFAESFEGFERVSQNVGVAGRSLALIADTLRLDTSLREGVRLTEAGSLFAKAGEFFASYLGIFAKNGFGEGFGSLQWVQGQHLDENDILSAKRLLADGVEKLRQGNDALTLVPESSLPETLRSKFLTARKTVSGFLDTAERFQRIQDALLGALGYMGPRRYLVLFQNSAELRPTGGFVGSYATIDMLDGKITRLAVEDVFDLDGQLVAKVTPPRPIQKISTAWSLHDANWFFDFPTSAKKVEWFYEKAGGATVDGVLAMTPETISRLLRITDPIALPAYGLTMDAETFADKLSYAIEGENMRHGDGTVPKQVLKDFAELFRERLRNALVEGKTAQVFQALNASLESREFMLYINNESLQSFVREEGWSGEVREVPGDYLSVVRANINGYKTNRVVKEKIAHEAAIAPDGSITDTVTISRAHPGSPDALYDALYNKVNTEYLRIFVPVGSTLVTATGFTREDWKAPLGADGGQFDYTTMNFLTDPDVAKIESTYRADPKTGMHMYEESGKTVFAGWTYVSPGESLTLSLTYRLPWKLDLSGPAHYSMYIQKQPGTHASFAGAVTIPPFTHIVEVLPKEAMAEKNGASIATHELDRDISYGAVIAPQ